MRQILIKSFLPVFSAVILVSGIAYAAWTGPTANPPGNNVSAPINVATNTQTFEGSKTLNVKSDGTGALLLKGGLGINGLLDVIGNIHATGDICTDMSGGKCLSDNSSGGSGTVPVQTGLYGFSAVGGSYYHYVIDGYSSGTGPLPPMASATNCPFGYFPIGTGVQYSDYGKKWSIGDYSSDGQYNTTLCYLLGGGGTPVQTGLYGACGDGGLVMAPAKPGCSCESGYEQVVLFGGGNSCYKTGGGGTPISTGLYGVCWPGADSGLNKTRLPAFKDNSGNCRCPSGYLGVLLDASISGGRWSCYKL